LESATEIAHDAQRRVERAARLFDQLDQLDDSAEKSALAIRHYRAAAAL